MLLGKTVEYISACVKYFSDKQAMMASTISPSSRLKDLNESLPSMLLCINDSLVEGKIYSNFLSITLEKDALNIARDFTDLFMKLYKPRVLNPSFEGKERFVYRGYYKQVFDIFTDRKGVRSSVVIDLLHGEILLPEAEIKLSKLHRREKALYAFLAEIRSIQRG